MLRLLHSVLFGSLLSALLSRYTKSQRWRLDWFSVERISRISLQTLIYMFENSMYDTNYFISVLHSCDLDIVKAWLSPTCDPNCGQ